MARPELFSELAYAEAQARAAQEEKLLLVDATAAWCAPCQAMERTTWRDADLTAWVRARAIAVQLDVDAHADIAQQLGIQAMPTVLLFRGGQELDRVTGQRPASELIAWLDAAVQGHTEVDRLRQKAEAGGDVMARYELAVTLARTGKLDEAAGAMGWLWEHGAEQEPAFSGVRRSFMANEMSQLAGTHPPARAHFSSLRDALQPEVDGGKLEAVEDWVTLNRVLGETAQTLAWFDGVGRGVVQATPALGPKLEDDLMPLLVKARRFADLGLLYVDPVATAAGRRKAVRSVKLQPGPPELALKLAEVQAAVEGNLRQRLAVMHVALIAAGRQGEADALLADIRATEDAPATLRTIEALQKALALR
jgi:thiol-disulfide isomerase/thioredoxin